MTNPVRTISNLKGITRRKSGFSLAAGAVVQYDAESDADLKVILRKYWHCNVISIVNNSEADIMVLPDYSENRAITCLAGSAVSREPDEELFQSFEVRNISSATAIATTDQVYIEIGNRRPKALGSRDMGRR